MVEPDLNLIPMLDMVSLLIQLLLLNAHFGSLVTVPSLTGRETDAPLDGAAIQLAVTPDALQLSWTESGERRAREIPCRGDCSAPGGYDLRGLRDACRELKHALPAERSVQLALHPAISFETIAAVMSAARGRTGDLFPDLVLGTAQ